MSEYYGYLTGHRGTATRCGSKLSGIYAKIRSWDNEVTAELRRDSVNEGKDILHINIPKGLRTIINGKEFKVK